MAARFLVYLALLLGIAGTAQASCTGALPMTCTPGATPVSTDLVLGGQNGQTVKFTIAQLASSSGGGGVVTQGTIPWVSSITGSVTVVQPTGTNLHVVCDSGCSGGGGGGGNVNVTQWDTINLGAPSNYGTSPGAVAVIGVNAFVTNPVAVTQTTGTNLHMVCDSGCSSSTAPADEAAFTFGTTSQTPVGGVYQTTATSNPLTTGQMGALQVTANRALFSNLRNAAGAEVGVAAAPLQVSVANTGANGTAIAVSAASLPLPALAATSTKQSDGTQKTQIVDGSGNVIASTSNNLDVQCANCSGSGVSAADQSSFTAGATLLAAGGGFFQTTATSNPLTTGQQGMFQMTANRALFSNLRNAAGTEVGTASTPLQVSVANTGANSTGIAVTSASGSIASGALAAGSGTDGWNVTEGTKADSAWTGSGSGSVIAILKSLFVAEGQALSASSLPVVPASDWSQTSKQSGSAAAVIGCDKSAIYDASTNGKTTIVALSGSTVVYVCGYTITATSSSLVHVSLSSGTGTNCASTSTNITPAYALQSAASVGPAGVSDGSAFSRGLKTAASANLCLVTDAAVSVQAIVYYTQF